MWTLQFGEPSLRALEKKSCTSDVAIETRLLTIALNLYCLVQCGQAD